MKWVEGLHQIFNLGYLQARPLRISEGRTAQCLGRVLADGLAGNFR
jgi:hypothetical protein